MAWRESYLDVVLIPARRPLPRGVPPLALARRPPQPAQLHRRHQRRRAPPLGLLHDEEQREAGDPGGAVGAERAHGLHAGGHDVHPLLHRRRRRAQQHLRREEAAQRRRLRRARRVHDGAQVRSSSSSSSSSPSSATASPSARSTRPPSSSTRSPRRRRSTSRSPGTTSPTSWRGGSGSTSPATGSSSPARRSCSGSSGPSCRASAPWPCSRYFTTSTRSSTSRKGAAMARPMRRWTWCIPRVIRALKSDVMMVKFRQAEIQARSITMEYALHWCQFNCRMLQVVGMHLCKLGFLFHWQLTSLCSSSWPVGWVGYLLYY
ncbi:hypothetical protein PVAP13_6NG303174 [Panicum virgatum]|uniref:Uncharacterized protein n=1 Tax=Panicum virgatum TaxID=38727 RepID=A0A8T0R2Z1_PANVG|nr:hypothetical protein PVAP13_6NG303174 [Panicum virgatum]